MRKRSVDSVATAVANRVRDVLNDQRPALIAELREAVHEAERQWHPPSETLTFQSSEPRIIGYERSVVMCVLTVAAMLENKADAMRIVTGEDAVRERELRSRVEDLRASVSGNAEIGWDADDVRSADVEALYEELST